MSAGQIRGQISVFEMLEGKTEDPFEDLYWQALARLTFGKLLRAAILENVQQGLPVGDTMRMIRGDCINRGHYDGRRRLDYWTRTAGLQLTLDHKEKKVYTWMRITKDILTVFVPRWQKDINDEWRMWA